MPAPTRRAASLPAWLPHVTRDTRGTPVTRDTRGTRVTRDMSLTSAVAHAAAAAAAGAGKKAAQVQLQAELNTDDEWNKFLLRDGLLVVDVYTEWCGPCIGMVGNLKKIKVELGGDNLHLAVAKSDTINCLQRFRNRSQPTWMFLAGGQLVNVVFGADAPRISRTIEQELRNEELVRRGERERVRRAPHELTPPEQEMANTEEKLQTERREREAAAAEAARWARREARALRLEAHFPDACPALLLPHAQKHLRKFADALEPFGVVVSDKMPLVVGRDGCRLLAAEEPVLDSDAALVALAERPALALLLKKQPDREGDVIELSRRAIFGDGQEAEEGLPPRRALADELAAGGLPGVLVPPDRHQRAALLDILFPKMVGAVVEPPVPAEPPHVAVMFGAWQRRAVLGAAARLGPDLLRFGFFADASVDEPRLLCKTLEQYDERVEKDYSETIVVMVSSGAAHTLAALGPLHTSADSVSGADECARFFPPGYSAPDHKPKPKAKKKKKKRHETKEETIEDSPEAAPDECAEDAAAEAEAEGEPDAEAEDDDDDAHAQDKATSPPPL